MFPISSAHDSEVCEGARNRCNYYDLGFIKVEVP